MQKPLLKIALIAILTVWQNVKAYPIDRFPGLNELIAKADVVAIVDIWDKSKGVGGDYLIQDTTIVHCLKGSIPDWTEMRLGFMNTPVNRSEIPRELQEFFIPPARYVVFLRKIENDSDSSPQYMTVFYEGSTLEISRLSKLSTVKDKNPQEAIIELLKDAVRIRKEQLKILEKQLSSVLDKQKTAQQSDTPNPHSPSAQGAGGR